MVPAVVEESLVPASCDDVTDGDSVLYPEGKVVVVKTESSEGSVLLSPELSVKVTVRKDDVSGSAVDPLIEGVDSTIVVSLLIA